MNEALRGGGLVAYVLARNEEFHIAGVVRSLLDVTDKVLVVDSESEDNTRNIAAAEGATIVANPFVNFSEQRNWALTKAQEIWDVDWILSLDADERLSDALIGELRTIDLESCRYDAFLIPRVVKFEGRLLRFGGTAKSRLLRLFRPRSGRYEERPVNEHFALTPDARLGELSAPIIHEDVVSWCRYIDKHNQYSSLEAAARLQTARAEELSLARAIRRPDLRRRWLRERVWNALPAKPALYFAYTYVARGGFLDGRPGLDRAIFGAWQELCSDLKWRELSGYASSSGLRGREAPHGTDGAA